MRRAAPSCIVLLLTMLSIGHCGLWTAQPATQPAAPPAQAKAPAAPTEPRLSATVEGIKITVTEARLGRTMLANPLLEQPAKCLSRTC
jgi:hypothetical protein